MALITYLEDPCDEERRAILQPLVADNLERGPDPDLRKFAFVLKSSEGRTSGGLWGRTAYDWAVIELLFVPQDLRGTGVGRTLVEKTEELARNRKCTGVWLDSFGFQAPDFYQKLGYQVFGELPDNPRGQSRYFLKKLFA
ncbi:GNAT family N-acetyltransferase [Palleronia aestuarii]|uniref:GNAT family N-acetyltransferase n=1 Tax=Palleronia aestuarii TaxID=568105 RepID=UPI000DAD2DC4|nr:GNAT family N-acetyltransferase [Palleronia aestuarii]